MVEKSTVGCQANRWKDITGTLNPVRGPGDPINITGVDDTWTAIRVRATTGAVAVGTITVAGVRTSADPLDLLVMPSDCMPELPDTPIANPSVTSWSGLTFGAGSESVRDAVRLTAAISGDLTGAIDCGKVYRLQVGGAIKAPVTAASPNDPSTNAAIAVISAGAVQNNGSDTQGSVTAGAGNIGFVQVGQVGVAGDLEGPVHAPQGRIASVFVLGDVLIADPIGIRARNGIDSTDAGSVLSKIVANDGATTLGPALKHLHCSELLGDVEADYIAPCDGCDVTENAITITGPWSGSLTVRGDVLAHIHQQGSQSGTVSIEVDGNVAATVRTESKIESLNVLGSFADLNNLGAITLQCLNGEGIGTISIGGNFGTPASSMLLSTDFIGKAEFGGHFAGLIRSTTGGPCGISEFIVGGNITLSDHQTWSGDEVLDCSGIFYAGDYSLHLSDSPPASHMRVGAYVEAGANEDQVRISPAGLQGQVILNAAGTYPPPEGWYGQFRSPAVVPTSIDSAQAATSPMRRPPTSGGPQSSVAVRSGLSHSLSILKIATLRSPRLSTTSRTPPQTAPSSPPHSGSAHTAMASARRSPRVSPMTWRPWCSGSTARFGPSRQQCPRFMCTPTTVQASRIPRLTSPPRGSSRP